MQRQRDVLQGIQRWQQIEKLENEADLVAPDAREIVVGKLAELLALDLDLAGSRTIQAPYQVQKRRFARAGWPDNRDHLALLDLKIHFLERHGFALSFEDFGDFLERDHQIAMITDCSGGL